MSRKRKNYTPEEKVRILKEYLVNGVPVSKLYDQHHLQPTVFYRWPSELMEPHIALKKVLGKNENGLAQKRGMENSHAIDRYGYYCTQS